MVQLILLPKHQIIYEDNSFCNSDDIFEVTYTSLVFIKYLFHSRRHMSLRWYTGHLRSST